MAAPRTESGESSRSPGRPPVPKKRIVTAALKIIDERGAEALSLRALAQDLDSSTATLYRHFANRAELISEVIDSVFDGVPADAGVLQAQGWEHACRTMASWMFDKLNEHPKLAPLLLIHAPVGPNAMALRETALALFLQAGFAPPVAVRSYATLARYVLGFAIQLGGNSVDTDPLAAAYLHTGKNTLPATAAVAEFSPVPLDEEFRFGLELLIVGLATRATS
jgi:AcrR family transcriptional regulator